MAKVYLSIDMGSKNIVIADRGGNVLFNEPTVVAMTNQNNVYTNIALGYEAQALANKNQNVQLVYPINSGAVDRSGALVYYLKTVFKRIVPAGIIKTAIEAIVSVSCGLNNSEKRYLEEACRNAGVKEVIIVESPISASTHFAGSIKFMVDIGSDKTEIAIVGDSGIITGCSIDVGGKSIDNAIIDYISDKYKIIIPPKNGEEIKCKLCSLREDDMSTISIKGRAVFDEDNSVVKVSANELRPVIMAEVDKIADVVDKVSMMIPEKFADNVLNSGFYFYGGTMAMPGLADYFKKKLYIRIVVPENPELTVATGGAKLFFMPEQLKAMLNVQNFEL